MAVKNSPKKTEKSEAKKPAAEKPAAKKPAAEKPAAKKPAAEKPAAKKPAAKKPAAKKQTTSATSGPLTGPLTESDIEALDFSDLAPSRGLEDASIDRDEGFMSTPDGLQIFWQSWSRDPSLQRASVALMHGYGEHSSRYNHIAAALVRAGYNVMAIDARGHGRSTGARAHVTRYHDYVSDLAMLKRKLEGRWPQLPLFVLGHSNGGLIALRYALTQPTRIRGFVVTSPLVAIKAEIPAAKAFAGTIMSKLWPSFSMPSGLNPDHVCQDSDVVSQYALDPLVLRVATARWFTETKLAGAELIAKAPQIDQPFLFLVAGNDAIVDPAAAERAFHRLGSRDRELEIYPDLFHEILNEKVWPDVVRRIIGWMERHRTDSTLKK
ncbi:MAG: alpha/beta hydrolase [Bradymonadaceae bacterium]|nr:alpha/beta hydrolase [Lujinxingiaceae bacterium]